MSGSFTQVSLFNVLLFGKYNGIMPLYKVKQQGNMAIATMDMLDGEVIMVDGMVYQARTDGKVYRPGDNETIPFGTIADFSADEIYEIRDVPSYEALECQIDELCPQKNLPLAFRVTGTFPVMQVRAVARQKNGVGLATATDQEAKFELKNIFGDLVGFRLPKYILGINAPGYHLHFIDSNREHGGHVVNFRIGQGVLQCCRCTAFHIYFPEDPSFLSELDLARDFTADLKKAEAERSLE